MNTLKNHVGSWQLVQLATSSVALSNWLNNKFLQGIKGSWQLANYQLRLPICQLVSNPCFYWVITTLPVGNITPLSLRERTPLGVVSASRVREFCWAAFKNSHLTFLKIFGGFHYDNSST